MSDQTIAGAAIGGVTGAAVAGLPGALVGGALGGLLADAYERKPVAANFATTLQNDLAPETVTLDAHQIYVRITTGPGAETLVAANEAAKRLSSSFADRAAQIARVRGEAGAAWQGAASTAAGAATTPLADSFAVAQQQLDANAQALDAEVTAFDHIRSQVEPVPATPPQSSIANSVNPFQTDTDAAINAYNAKAAKNVALYEGYVAATGAARSQVPLAYANPAPISGTATAVTRTGSPVDAAAIPPPRVGSAGAGQPATTGASAASGGSPSAPPAAGGASGMTGGAGAGTGGGAGAGVGASDGSGRQAPSVTTPAASAPGGVPLVPAGRTAYAGHLPGTPRRAGLADTQRNFTGAGPGGGGPGAFTGGVGTGGGGGGGVRTGGVGAGGPAPRGGPSVTTGPVSGQPPATQPAGRGGVGGPGVRGAAGPGGVPMGAAGRGNGEEDQEHRRRYRVEPDDKELFGLDEPYVPPVIGDHR